MRYTTDIPICRERLSLRALDEIAWNHEARISRLEDALRVLASEPGSPHHAAELALEILNRES